MSDDERAALWRSEWRRYKEVAEEAFAHYGAKSNDLVRQIALAGIAVVWVFRETTAGGSISLEKQLRWAAIFFVLTLAFDLFHYLCGTYQMSNRLDAIKVDEHKDVSKGQAWPTNPSGPPPDVVPETGVLLLFVAKTGCVLTGASLLLYYLAVKV